MSNSNFYNAFPIFRRLETYHVSSIPSMFFIFPLTAHSNIGGPKILAMQASF